MVHAKVLESISKGNITKSEENKNIRAWNVQSEKYEWRDLIETCFHMNSEEEQVLFEVMFKMLVCDPVKRIPLTEVVKLPFLVNI